MTEDKRSMIDVSDRTQEFLMEFKRLESLLRQVAHMTDGDLKISKLIAKAAAVHPLINSQAGLILDLAGLRNVFSHAEGGQYIAEIKSTATEQLRKLISTLEHPPLIGDLIKKNVYVATTQDIVDVVIQEMRKNLYTHVPVYRDGAYVGVLSETSVFDWLGDNLIQGKANFQKQTLGDFNPKYLECETNAQEFVSYHESAFDVLQRFQSAITSRRRLGVIFVTENGNTAEEITGVVTAWDLPELQQRLSL